MRVWVALIVLLCGCSSQIVDLHEYLPERERIERHKTTDSVFKYYFTDEAYAAIKDVPVIEGFTIGGSYVAGANFWGNLASFATLNGIGRKMIMNKETIQNHGFTSLIHEAIHHLDDMTRDGDADFIDIHEFKTEFDRLEEFYTTGYGIQFYPFVVYRAAIIKRADRTVTNLFGLGEHSEEIAYASEYLLKYRNWPQEFKHVFRKIFRPEVMR